MDAIINRRSVRKFDLSKRVSDEELLELCHYAEQGPTARNQSSRAYVIINDEKIISMLSEVSQGTAILKGCNTCIAILGNDPSKLTTPLMQSCDLGAATENMLLHATEMGLGSCWMGIYPMEERMARVKEILNIDANDFVYALVAIGYPSEPESCFYNRNKEAKVSFNRR